MALIDERVQDADEFFAVAEVETDRRFFEQVEIAGRGAAGAFAVGGEAGGKFGDEFETLGFPAGEGG